MPNDNSTRTELEALIARIAAADFGDGDPGKKQELNAFLGDDDARHALHGSVMDLWNELALVDPPVAGGLSLSSRLASWVRERSRLAIAAGLAPLIALGALLAIYGGAFGSDHYRAEIHAGAAERRIVNLPDGSTVSLSADSIVAIDLEPARRNFMLKQGEALFEVAHDPDRPFVVAAGEGEIQAIGTAFNVRLARTAVVVTVVEGTVRIAAGKSAASEGRSGLVQLATAGQQVRFGKRIEASPDGSAFISRPKAVDPGRYASWAEGLLRFEGEPLAQVIAEVNRHSATDIKLTDPRLASTPIYGVLHIGDVEGLKSIVADIERLDDEAVSEKLTVVRGEN